MDERLAVELVFCLVDLLVVLLVDSTVFSMAVPKVMKMAEVLAVELGNQLAV